jgi:hypothetical protein
MPPLQPVPDVVKAQFRWVDASDAPTYNQLFFSFSGSGPDSEDCHDFALAIGNAMATHNALWTVDTSVNSVVATDLSSDTAATGDATVTGVGTDEGESLPGGAAFVTSYSIARRYRGGRPRNYWPWGSAAQLMSRQAWTAEFLAAGISSINSVIAAVVGETYGGMTITNHVNVSYYKGSTVETNPRTGRAKNVPTPRATPLVDVITGVLGVPYPGSQRRRNR